MSFGMVRVSLFPSWWTRRSPLYTIYAPSDVPYFVAPQICRFQYHPQSSVWNSFHQRRRNKVSLMRTLCSWCTNLSSDFYPGGKWPTRSTFPRMYVWKWQLSHHRWFYESARLRSPRMAIYTLSTRVAERSTRSLHNGQIPIWSIEHSQFTVRNQYNIPNGHNNQCM